MVLANTNYSGGLQQYAFNFIKSCSSAQISFDLIHFNWKSSHFSSTKTINEELNNYNVNIYELADPAFSFVKFYKQADKFFKINAYKYDIIHVHPFGLAFVFLKLANKYKIKGRIFHAHENKLSEIFIHEIRNYFTKTLSIKNSNKLLACSKIAGDYMFHKRKYEVIYSCIDFNMYKYCLKWRKKIREKLNIKDNTFVLGHVGRLCKQKNQIFCIDVLKELWMKYGNEYLLVLIGEGPDKENIQEYVKNNHLENNVKLLSSKKNINEYYSAFDCLLFPSLYEGLGLVAVEAQMSGLPCVISSSVPNEARIKNCIVIDTHERATTYADTIHNIKLPNRNLVSCKEFDMFNAEKNAEKLISIYKELGK